MTTISRALRIVIITSWVCLVIFMCAVCAHDAYAEQPQVASMYTYMEIVTCQPGYAMMLMDEKGSIYSTHNYPKYVYPKVAGPPKPGDVAIVQMTFEYVGNQLFVLDHLKVVNIHQR